MTTTIVVLTIAAIGMFFTARWIDKRGFCSGCKYNESGNIRECIWNCPREEKNKDESRRAK